DVGDGGQALRMVAAGVLRIAAGIAVELEEEAKLHGHAAAGAVRVPGAVARISTLRVGVDRIVAVGDRIGDARADLVADCGGAWRRIGVVRGARRGEAEVSRM